ncbi:MAG: S-layer homology domain-containing protein [Ruminococcaceae bacterium]|nr:S-layer homology domain-containing protein [Oscillospiraceae bacterium]
MKKKFMRGIAAFLAAVMMLPTAAFAETTYTPPTAGMDFVEIKSGDVLYDGGEDTELQLELAESVDPSKVKWNVVGDSSAYITVDQNGLVKSKGLVGADGAETTTVQVRAVYDDGANSEQAIQEIALKKRTIEAGTFKVDTTYDIQKMYTIGESFNTDGIQVTVKYSDAKSTAVELDAGDYTIEPATFTTAGEQDVTIKYAYNGTTVQDTIGVMVEAAVVDTVKSVEVLTPYDGLEVEKDYVINEVRLLVTWNSGKTESINAKTGTADFEVSSDYTLGSKITKDTTFYVKYKGVSSQNVTIKVVDTTPEKTITGIDARPSKIEYSKGDSISKSADVKVYVKWSDGSESELTTSQFALSPSSFTTTGTVTVTATAKSGEKQYSDTYTVTVKDSVTITGLDKDTDEYELKDKDDIELKVGDKLNDDVHWYDIFDEVRLIVDGTNKLIDSKSDLEEYSNVELLLKVYNKTTNSTTIESKDIGSDGKVRLQLYVKVGTKSITDTSYSIREYIPVTDAECTVSIYSGTYVTSTYLKASKSFNDFDDALEALKDENELEEVFDITLGSKYTIRIKFGEDQELSSSYEFEPDYENSIYIDLNGYELKLPSDWIVYDDCEDLVVTITNSSREDDGKLIYRDKSVSLIVAEGSALKFSDGEIPMDSDAAVTMTIYRSSSSTTKIDEKVYDDLEEALEALEDHDDAVETFDISSSYEDSFVAKIKLGEDEDQDLTSFTFAPNYDTTITIDLNGNKLELDTDWIDYDDCEDLVIKINNTHEDDKATLFYDDEDITIAIAKNDSALEFKEDKVPGIYAITIDSMTNGKASVNKETVGHGGSVTFTITPNENYEIETVKVNNKTVSASNYTVNSKGVGTFELKDIVGDAKFSVTFKKTSSTTTTEKEEDKPTSSTKNWTNPFTDVSKNAQYYDAVAFVCSEGLFNGMTATKFEPTTTMTRAMFVTVLGRLAGIDPLRYSGTSFIDVSKTDQQISWAAPYIEWAVQEEITNGTGNGKFSPNDPITHQQMYLFMKRYAERIANVSTATTGVSLSSIKDASQIADWAQEGVKFASKHNILITSGGKLTPTDNALRCELAMLLHGFCVKVLGYND